MEPQRDSDSNVSSKRLRLGLLPTKNVLESLEPQLGREKPTSHKTLCFGGVEPVPGASNLVPASNTFANILANVVLVLRFGS